MKKISDDEEKEKQPRRQPLLQPSTHCKNRKNVVSLHQK